MNKHMLLFLRTLVSLFVLAGCSESTAPDHAAESGHGAAATADYERGPHRGRILRKDAFAIEVTIFETGVPPQFRLYAYQNAAPLPAQDVTVSIELSRLDGTVDSFTFAPEGEHLVGSGTVIEPHSFDVKVRATHADQTYEWTYASYEGRTTLPSATAEAAGIHTAVAGPTIIDDRIRLMGRVTMNVDRVAYVRARFPGPVLEIRVNQGDQVKAGQTLAILENRETLRSYVLAAPISGVVLARNTNAGNAAGDDPLFEIADLSTLWVELNAFGAQADAVQAGQSIRVTATGSGRTAETIVDRLLPLANSASQTLVARGLLPNPDGLWRPGMTVQGEITIASHAVPLAVSRDGLQRFRDFTVVFAQVGETYEVRMLELGRQDDTHVEILGGLKPGTTYVTEQSFLIKADIEKSGASHDH
jgi:cobalt-zinc-cadmium efflux system membrane fusion protein